MGFRKEECFFWATHAGAELDLLVVKGKDKQGCQIICMVIWFNVFGVLKQGHGAPCPYG